MMKRLALKYLFLRTASSVAGLLIIILNLYMWNIFPSEIHGLPPAMLNWAILFGFQTFLFFFLGFMIADSVSRFWWSRWRTVKTSALIDRSILVPGTHAIPGKLYQLVEAARDESPGRLVIVSYGFNDNQFRAQHIAKAIAALGYSVFTWDYRGRDASKGKITDLRGHVEDLRALINYWTGNSIVSPGEIYLCGWSLGGMVSIIAGLDDNRVRKIFVWSTWSDLRRRVLWRVYANPLALLRYLFKGELLYVSRKENEAVSPVYFARRMDRETGGTGALEALVKAKLFMCHVKNDSIVGFDNFKENAKAFHLPGTNQFVFKKGSHMIIRKESIVLGLLSRFFTGGDG